MTIFREDVDAVYRTSFGAFVYRAFEALNPGRKLVHNWHIDSIAFALEQMAGGQTRNRLVINLPPRTLKTFIISICFVAWLLGRNPTLKFVCVSYSEDLANKLSRDCRSLMDSKFYKRVFPRTRVNPKKSNEGEFESTRRGYRLATSSPLKQRKRAPRCSVCAWGGSEPFLVRSARRTQPGEAALVDR